MRNDRDMRGFYQPGLWLAIALVGPTRTAGSAWSAQYVPARWLEPGPPVRAWTSMVGWLSLVLGRPGARPPGRPGRPGRPSRRSLPRVVRTNPWALMSYSCLGESHLAACESPVLRPCAASERSACTIAAGPDARTLPPDFAFVGIDLR